MEKGNYNDQLQPDFWNIAIPGLLGVLGLVQGQDQARRQQNMQNKALSQQEQGLYWQNQFNEAMFPAFQKLIGLAQNYDPEKEAVGTVNRAQGLFEGGLAKALNKYNADYARGGGNPGQSTEETVGRQGAINAASGPFQEFMLNATADPTLKKAQLLQVIQGIPAGSLTRSYFDSASQLAGMSQMYNTNMGGSLNLLSQLFDKMFAPSGGGNPMDYNRPGYRGS